MEGQQNRGKSALHWENKKARACLETQNHLLVAELIREYLEFYSLDYSKQIFLPETNLNSREPASREHLVESTGMN